MLLDDTILLYTANWVEGGQMVSIKPIAHSTSALDAGSQELNIDVAQLFKDAFFVFMRGVCVTEKFLQFFISVFCLVHFPYSQVITQEWKGWSRTFNPRFQGSAGNRQSASLAATCYANPISIYIWHSHHDPGKLGSVKKYLPEEHFLRRSLQGILQSPNDMPMQRIAGDIAIII